MKGLERITQRIQTDAQGQIEALTAAGRRQAQEITEKYEDQARRIRKRPPVMPSRISGEPRAAPTAPAGSSSSPASSSSLTIPSDRPGSS